ncbi:MAG: TRAP transporter substrate-binding protein DctP [Armatimonadetes bacterium]|nr:TRAP transporter substrate-binding protein DctP [Armatimonadota bacterium]
MKRLLTLMVTLCCLAPPAAAEVVLRLGHTGSPGSLEGTLAARFQSELSSRAAGVFKLSVLDGSAHSRRREGDLNLMRAVLAGEPQLAIVRSSPLANFHRPMALLSPPCKDPEPAWEERVLASMQGKGLRGLALLDGGPRLFASRRPLHSLEDLVGMRIRVPQSLVSIDTARLLGANPVPSAVGRTAEMARRNYVDGADLTYPDLAELELQQVFPYLLEPGYGRERLVVIVNERFYRTLAPAQRQLLADVGRAVAGYSVAECRSRVERIKQGHAPVALGAQEREALARRLEPARQRILRLVGADREADR